MGVVIPNGPLRNGYPVTSEYDKKKKKDKRRKGGRNWTGEFLALDLSEEEAKARLKDVQSRLKEVGTTVKKQTQELSTPETELSDANKKHREFEKHVKKTTQSNPLLGATYQELKNARGVVREIRTELAPLEAEQRLLTREQYYWQKICKAAESANRNSATAKSAKTEIKMTKPTSNHPVAEDFTESMDLSGLTDHCLIYSGTDYGLKKMSVTVPMTQTALFTHINRFHVLGKLNNRQYKRRRVKNSHTLIVYSISVEGSDGTQDTEEDFNSIRIPKPIVITAAQINQISHAKATSARRERRLRQDRNSEVRDAMGKLSNQATPLRHAVSMDDIDRSLETIRNVGPTLQRFESTPANMKDGHTRDLRTKRAWSKMTGSERTKIKEHYCSQGKHNVCHPKGHMNA